MAESDTTPSQRMRPPPPPLYRNTGGEAAIRAVYDRLLAALPYDHEQRLVQTSFGTAHVLVCGPADAEPLVLWHGMGAPGPTMLEGFAPLISRFRTYVPDMPYQGIGSQAIPLAVEACVREQKRHRAVHAYGNTALIMC